ncbi:conserved oligomeric Golgi complex subunit 1 isoform X1 [Stegostoma tigrinum]|uniref:conserved oligomeric Golgi complex subunit 1 isoform X1 n=1 Tax=Stegostoma tigrinum TaxID=3053191 RepID=UPI00286FF0B4|nr:conserved oligomeric Golgi complex subunit 1 isoform X1 [Stegostoma tigrinum]
MAVAARNLRVSDIQDPGSLFERYGTEEIRQVERRVRAEIEHKKEELRQMVGERYRDLIEAADTITDMRLSSEKVVTSVRHMYEYCTRIKPSGPGRAAPVPAKRNQAQQQSQEKFYNMAAQIKLLLNMPEKIWSALESSQYLHATQMYLLCCHIHSILHLDSSGSYYSPVLARFPILVRQVAAAGHFRASILQESKILLKGRAISDQAIAEALCAIMLLEDSSPRQALADFLLARKSAIQQSLNQLHHGAGIKAQVCSLVELLAATLYQAQAVFYTSTEGKVPDNKLTCGLLFTTLASITSESPADKGITVLKEEMKSETWFKYLPPSIVDFQPSLRTLAHPINRDYLRDTLQQWINMCKDDIKIGIGNLLIYVKSLKGLAGIRDAVWELLTSESISQNWETLCSRLLEKPFSFWEDFLQQLFLDRLQALTKEGLESISNSSKQLLVSAVQDLHVKNFSALPNKAVEFEYNVAAFLWSESSNDLLSDTAWVSIANRSQFVKSGLSMKAQALTLCVQSFCSALDSKLKVKLDDLVMYLPPDSSTVKDNSNDHSSSQLQNSAFDRYADTAKVEEMLRTHCLSCVQYILDCVKVELKTAEEGLQNCIYSPKDCNLSAVLFMARLCQSIGELCPHLKQCIWGRSSSNDQLVREPRPVKKLGKGKAQEVKPAQAKWQEVKDQLLQQSTSAYRIWNVTISKALVYHFTRTLLSHTAGAILSTATNWDEIEIQEETEAGNSVTSKIRLPVQPSWYVQSLLFQLCQEVNRVGGHALPKVTLQELLKTCLDEVLTGYETLCSAKLDKGNSAFPLTQNRALQLLFDLRYLGSILTARNEEVKSSRIQQDPRVQKVADTLESYIDPFDLDVFTPHLNNNLNKLSQRTSVLFGLLTGTEKQYTNRSVPFNSQEAHNILPLASSQIRFGLLPLSMSSSRKPKSSVQGNEVKNQVLPSSVIEDASQGPGSLFRQLADFQDDDVSSSSSSSLFKLGWLSSMTK